jgi:hypothetical protein
VTESEWSRGGNPVGGGTSLAAATALPTALPSGSLEVQTYFSLVSAAELDRVISADCLTGEGWVR